MFSEEAVGKFNFKCYFPQKVINEMFPKKLTVNNKLHRNFIKKVRFLRKLTVSNVIHAIDIFYFLNIFDWKYLNDGFAIEVSSCYHHT